MTNFDVITESPEKLAEFMETNEEKLGLCETCERDFLLCHFEECKKQLLKWLNSEAKENDDGK